MNILNSLEREAHDIPPQFSSAERKKHFEIPAALVRIADTLRNPTNRVAFILACGYFSATKRFFTIRPHRV